MFHTAFVANSYIGMQFSTVVLDAIGKVLFRVEGGGGESYFCFFFKKRKV